MVGVSFASIFARSGFAVFRSSISIATKAFVYLSCGRTGLAKQKIKKRNPCWFMRKLISSKKQALTAFCWSPKFLIGDCIICFANTHVLINGNRSFKLIVLAGLSPLVTCSAYSQTFTQTILKHEIAWNSHWSSAQLTSRAVLSSDRVSDATKWVRDWDFSGVLPVIAAFAPLRTGDFSSRIAKIDMSTPCTRGTLSDLVCSGGKKDDIKPVARALQMFVNSCGSL